MGHADAEYYGAAFPEVYKQAVTPADAIDHIAIVNELQDNSVKLVFAETGDGTAQLTWFLGGHTASLSQLLPMLQSMGVVVLEERPFTVNRSDGMPVWIYQFKISPHPTIRLASTQAERDGFACVIIVIVSDLERDARRCLARQGFGDPGGRGAYLSP